MLRVFQLPFVLFFVMALPVAVQADGFGINATRLIYLQKAKSISVTLRNTMAAQPYLVQVKISRSQDGSEPAPFVVTPPLFRMEPSTVNQVRIMMQPTPLPNDRESVFYLHAGAIPASTAPTSGSQSGVFGGARFGVGNIIKLFYRPANLPSSPAAAQKNLQFSWVKDGLQVSNPSPYFVSFASLQVEGHALKLDTPAELMLAPFSQHTYPTANTLGSVRWQAISDEGGVNAFSHKLP